ncbi:MAG TPA: hypothetical protein VKF84_18260, partial [Candidatus Sulfotelmatobacter sp.]|nr:hypothetical protein [Candidatus Sulfotelmatobacter sp.]
DAFPVMQVLFSKRGVEAVGVARGGDVGGGSAFAEHLRDGVSGDQVDEEEDEADDQPDDGEGVEDALDYSSQLAVLSSQLSTSRFRSRLPVSRQFSVATL